MVELLEEAVADMQARACRLRTAGVRVLTPSVEEPFVLVLVDELASLTAYLTDRRLSERVDNALQLLTSQGRAPGFCLMAALQDPSKEVIPYRNLFPVRVALRLDEPQQVDMVLGDSARDRGAYCDRIPRALPGIAYVKEDGVREPLRVRAGWVTDEDIADMAGNYQAPNGGPVNVPGQPTAAAPAPPDRQPAAAVALPGEPYLSDEELSDEWAAFAKTYRDSHPRPPAAGDDQADDPEQDTGA